LSSDTIPEQQMFDLAVNTLRTKLINIPGIQVPYPYGGKQRQVMVDIDPERLYARGISPADVSTAVNSQSIIVPAGTVKIGPQEYQVRLNASPDQVAQIKDLPIKTLSNPDGTKTTIFLRDVANVRDGFQVQTNIVHSDGKRGVLISIYKNGNASTLDVVDNVKKMLPDLQAALPPGAREGLKITPLFDQSVFVRASVEGVVKEAAIAAGLTGLMILLFLGSWRSTLIVVISIPLSILVSIIIMGSIGETLNTMTLGGMALAVGILVDDATVSIENIHRNLHMKKRLVQAILDGAQEIAVPAFVSTLCICIVFAPVVLIAGAAKYLFTPLALAVVFAMMTSYVLSRTLVPTMVHYLLAGEVEMYGGELDPEDPHAKAALEAKGEHGSQWKPAKKSRFALKLSLIVIAGVLAALVFLLTATPVGAAMPWASTPLKNFGAWAAANPIDVIEYLIILAICSFVLWLCAKYDLIWRVHFAFNRQFERMQRFYGSCLAWTLTHRAAFASAFGVAVVASLILFSFVGRDFFPSIDAGQIRLHVRTPAGTRIEQTERYYGQVQDVVRKIVPASEVSVMLDNMGIPNSGINLSLSDGSVNAPSEGEVLVSLKEGHKPTEQYIRQIRKAVAAELPDLQVWSAPADIATQVLNFGLPAAVDVQIAGPLRNASENQKLIGELSQELATVPGVTDRRLQQVSSAPDIRLNVDRTLAGQLGLTQRDVASDLLVSLSSSSQTAPNFWLNPANGINYSIFVQTPQYKIETPNDLTNTPVIAAASGSDGQSQILANLATLSRGASASNITHRDIAPTYDVLLGVEHLDLGRVSTQVQGLVDKYRGKLPVGSTIALRGQVQSMNDSFTGLGVGLIFAVVLVYLLMVVNFQSWVDPLIILMALPGAAAGIIWMLWGTNTTFSVPALMGALMSIGVATANSILLITFANDQRRDMGMNAHDAALSAGLTRLRPVIMTATAMIIGMLPMSLGLGEGGEQNAPLGRAVIGGLLMATVATLFFVPIMYSLLRKKAPQTQVEKELQ
ncbi:MAG: acriflavin resistance protein, partial [Phycisphaerales bacterium]|nr:acriflavin resistance protein [Phycisphaerales bacterium]